MRTETSRSAVMTPDAPMFHAADRNKDAILGVLRQVLPSTGTVVEIASGGGQHLSFFSAAMPALNWLPSEAVPTLVTHLNTLANANLLPAVAIDVCQPGWDAAVAATPNAIISANMIHIAPWEACLGLFEGSARLLGAGGLVYFYGPFVVDGKFSSDGNESFDRSLRDRNPDWGLRELEMVCEAASGAGFDLDRTVDMPVNNLSVIFRR